MALSRIQLLMGHWTEELSSPLGVGCSSPSIACHLGLSISQFTAWQLVFQASEREWAGAQMAAAVLLESDFGGDIPLFLS